MPRNSRTYEEEIGGEEFGFIEGILTRIEFFAHTMVWAQTKDAKYQRNKPELAIPSHIRNLQKAAQDQETAWKIAMTPEEIRAEVYGGGFK